MFSKLRPHHKRSGSTPSSPTPHSLQTSGFLQPPGSSHGASSAASAASATSTGSIARAESPSPTPFYYGRTPDGAHPGLQQREHYASPALVESPVSPHPPSLPPIPRIASVCETVPAGEQPLVQGQEHGLELRRERSPAWQQPEENRHHNQKNEWEGRPVQGVQFTMQENRSHCDIPEEIIPQPISRPHTSGEPSMSHWREDQSAFQLATQDIQSRERKSSYLRTQEIISQAARRPFELSNPPMVPPKDRFPYLRQNSMPVGGSKAQEVIPPLPFTQDEDEDDSRPGHHYRQFDAVLPPAVPIPNDVHQVYSRNPPLQLGNQPGLRQSSNQHSQQAPARHNKNMFHLLNPMSLLSRRRNGHDLEQLSEDSLISAPKNPSVSPLPEGYDPSIRGKVVHDFSAPRRNFSSQSMMALGDMSASRNSYSREGHESNRPRKRSDDTLHVRHERQSQHTPVFKEHFDDDPDENRNTNASAIHAESLANKDFLVRNSLPAPEHEPFSPPSLLPPFARTAKTTYKPLPADPPLSPPEPLPLPPTLASHLQPPEAYVGLPATSGPLSPLMEDPVSPLSEERDGPPKDTTNANTTTRNMSMRKPPTSRSRVGSRASFGSRSSIGSDFQPAGLPAHMHSRASRFSFQYANTDSAAQEKILEERHRQKAAAKALANQNREAEEDQSEEEEYEMDYDDMDYDDMDDDVPMVGEDWDYGGGGMTGGSGNMTLNSSPAKGMMMGMNGLNIQAATKMALGANSVDDGGFGDFEDEDEMQHQGLGAMTFDDIPGGNVEHQGLGNMTLDDMRGEAQHDGLGEMSFDGMLDGEVRHEGLGDTSFDDMPANRVQHPGLGGMSFDDMPTGEVHGLGILPTFQDDELDIVSPLEELELRPALHDGDDGPAKASVPLQDDNFYFDDGEFDDADFADTDTKQFDESVLDDPSHPLYERAPVGVAPPIPAKSLRRVVPQNSKKLPGSRRSLPSEPGPALSDHDPDPEHPDPNSSMDVISRYQSALALAATKAFADGRFARDDSMEHGASDTSSQPNEGIDGDEENVSSRSSLVPDDGRFSQATTMSPPTARASEISDIVNGTPSKSVGFLFPGAYNEDMYSSDFDYSDYDSAVEDDAFIAAANAEALENDDEGVYGTEFGFYARPGFTDASTDADGNAVYGGYFGPKNWGEVKRQKSTREPNLTPITERSEYSTRNSYISLHHGDRNAASSPSLNALAQLSPGWESDMNMETLMRLRRGAWGGSQRSNNSSRGDGNSPMTSSPVFAKVDPRALWSSPIRQAVAESDSTSLGKSPGQGFYEDYLDDVNNKHEEVDYECRGYEDEWEDASNEDSEKASSYEEEGEDDSPTIRADLNSFTAEFPTSMEPIKNPPSPVREGFPRQTHQDLPTLMTPASPSTTSTSQTAQLDAVHSPVFTTSSRPNSLGLVSPTSPSLAQQKRQSGNGSDSVAYVRERDEDGGPFRWFLERRRTGEDGIESLVGRTLVEGGRI
ncbi:Pre-mRNA-splicing factor [Venturia nashicola]|uniref:Pre-mRNA-splicing factor n=1 Tax=Venturia nashicola TaxID=86259 RepID=A0A4Z1NL15_9PEZI|nr:Pre-mRNA-splicing factor [Venturia nashicola]